MLIFPNHVFRQSFLMLAPAPGCSFSYFLIFNLISHNGTDTVLDYLKWDLFTFFPPTLLEVHSSYLISYCKVDKPNTWLETVIVVVNAYYWIQFHRHPSMQNNYMRDWLFPHCWFVFWPRRRPFSKTHSQFFIFKK